MDHVSRIKELLRNTDLKFTEIAKEVGVSPKTVQNINNGRTHFDPEAIYPMRPSGIQISEFKNRLSRPDIRAVPRPNVLSPQLLDYIGMLSMLGNDIDCLVTFKDVFKRPLEEIFERELDDKDITSIIRLQPKFPHQLNQMIEAFNNPKVKFINTKYWINSGFISTNEENYLYSLFK